MKHVEHYRQGLISLTEMVQRELLDCQYAGSWLKDVFQYNLSKDEYSRAWYIIDNSIRQKALNSIINRA